MKKILIILLTLSINILLAQSITVQGVLRDGNNRAVSDGSYELSFSIYSQSSGGELLWPENSTHNETVAILNGVYSLDLPVGTNIQTGSSELFLQVAVDGSTMNDRVRLNLSPYEYYNSTGGANAIPASGNVGIGVSTPSHRLHIVKNEDIDIDNPEYAFAISEGSQDNLIITKEGHVQTGGNMNARSFNDLTGNVSPVGSITMFAGATAPEGWLLCDGEVLPPGVEYEALAGVLNGNYGEENNRSKVPDLRGRTAIGLDNMGGTSLGVVTNSAADNLGGKGGAENHSLNDSETPNKYFTFSPGSASLSCTGTSQACVSGSCVGGNCSLSHSGGTLHGPHTETDYYGGSYNSTPHNNMQPYVALNYIIKY